MRARTITGAHWMVLAVAAACAMAVPADAQAQDGFLFQQPRVTLELRLGQASAGANGDVFDLMTEELTLSRGDFTSTSFSGDVAFRTSPRLDLVFGFAHAKSESPSESRNFVEQDDQPIRQSTELSRTPLTAGLRIYPMSRGTSVGQHAWIPAKLTPYVGVGAGIMRYSLQQSGDFVDPADLAIHTDEFESSGTGWTVYGEAGATYWIHQTVGITGGARYSQSEAGLNGYYRDYDQIDLSGFQASAGLALRF